jgi:hypothetical protein
MKALLICLGTAAALAAGAANADQPKMAEADPARLDIRPLAVTADGATRLEAMLAKAAPPARSTIVYGMHAHYLADGSVRMDCERMHDHPLQQDLPPHDEAEK